MYFKALLYKFKKKSKNFNDTNFYKNKFFQEVLESKSENFDLNVSPRVVEIENLEKHENKIAAEKVCILFDFLISIRTYKSTK